MIDTRARLMLSTAALLIGAAAPAQAEHVATVLATDNIYGAGLAGPLGGGTVPHALNVPATAACFVVKAIRGSLSCSAKLGCISLNHGNGDHGRTNFNAPDGNGAQVSMSRNNGTATVSGLTAPGAGYLVGLFVAGKIPTGPAPAALDFSVSGGTSFATLAPLLDQSFFVGDGRTQRDNGPRQQFLIPHGTTRLYLGISDACGYVGSPSCYFDNIGEYQLAISFRTSCLAP